MILADPGAIRVVGTADKSAGEPGYASEPVDFMAVRDTLDWSLPPVWGLPTAGGQTPIIPRRMVEYTDNARFGAGRFEIESVTHYVTGRDSSRVISTLGQGEPAGAAFVHRITRASPRARLAGRPVYASDEKDAIAAYRRLGAEVGDRIVVEDPDRPLAPEAVVAGTATITRDDPEHVAIAVEAATPAYLALADSFDPGWTATVDARPAPIRPAWMAFRAVYVGPGRHTVVFRYRPAGFVGGLCVSVLGLVAAGVLLLWRRPSRPVGTDHAPLGWPARWPVWGLLVVAVVLAGSVVGIGRNGAIRLQSRWSDSWHPFTWGAGIEAMHSHTPG
jgi:hypothetical protein